MLQNIFLKEMRSGEYWKKNETSKRINGDFVFLFLLIHSLTTLQIRSMNMTSKSVVFCYAIEKFEGGRSMSPNETENRSILN